MGVRVAESDETTKESFVVVTVARTTTVSTLVRVLFDHFTLMHPHINAFEMP